MVVSSAFGETGSVSLRPQHPVDSRCWGCFRALLAHGSRMLPGLTHNGTDLVWLGMLIRTGSQRAGMVVNDRACVR